MNIINIHNNGVTANCETVHIHFQGTNFSKQANGNKILLSESDLQNGEKNVQSKVVIKGDILALSHKILTTMSTDDCFLYSSTKVTSCPVFLFPEGYKRKGG